MVEFHGPVVYDAGALLAAGRGDDRMRALHRRFLVHGLSPYVPAPVLSQAWRGDPRQVGLARVLKGCAITPTDEDTARRAGVLLGQSGTSDAVDAIVVVTALHLHAVVVTSDPKELRRLGDAALESLRMVVL